MTMTEQKPPAAECRLEGGVRALDPERDAFERWWCKAYHPAALQAKERGCYLDRSAGMAWDAWQAARPKRAAVGAVMNVAAALAQRKPLTAFGEIENARSIGYRQFARVYDKADEDTRLLAVKLVDAARAL
jgi:hypothetical protein